MVASPPRSRAHSMWVVPAGKWKRSCTCSEEFSTQEESQIFLQTSHCRQFGPSPHKELLRGWEASPSKAPSSYRGEPANDLIKSGASRPLDGCSGRIGWEPQASPETCGGITVSRPQSLWPCILLTTITDATAFVNKGGLPKANGHSWA